MLKMDTPKKVADSILKLIGAKHGRRIFMEYRGEDYNTAMILDQIGDFHYLTCYKDDKVVLTEPIEFLQVFTAWFTCDDNFEVFINWILDGMKEPIIRRIE